MTITYPPEMLPAPDDGPGDVIVCSNSECCLKAEVERLCGALEEIKRAAEFPEEHSVSELGYIAERALAQS